jgi:indole-3-glycerol phosphate synthase
VYETRAAGADAVLLIVACLEPGRLRELHALVRDLGMAPLVEVHTAAEAEIALSCEPILVGINNRDLHTFTVNLETTERLRPLFPPDVCIVAESGIKSRADAARLAAAGADAMLVGESLVTAADTRQKIRSLLDEE